MIKADAGIDPRAEALPTTILRVIALGEDRSLAVRCGPGSGSQYREQANYP